MAGTVKKAVEGTVKHKWISFGGFTENSASKSLLTIASNYNCECVGQAMQVGVRCVPFVSQEGTTMAVATNLRTPYEWFVLNRTVSEAVTQSFGYITAAGELCEWSERASGFSYTYNIGLESKGVLVTDADKQQMLVYVGQSGAYSYYDNGSDVLISKRFLPVGCFCGGRLFTAMLGRTLVYCTPFSPHEYQVDVDDCGEIQLAEEAGEIVALVASGSFVYVFCEYGIFRLAVAGSARQFKIERIPYAGGLIFGRTACAVGEDGLKMFFLADSGLYTLQGKNVTRLYNPCGIAPALKQTDCRHGLFDGKYWVCFADQNGKQRAVAIDVQTQTAYESIVPQYASPILGGTLCVYDGTLCKMRTGGLSQFGAEGTFTTNVNLATGKNSTLKSIRVLGEGEATLCVDNGHESVTVHLQFQNGVAQANVHCKGDTFTWTFTLKDNAIVRDVQAEVAVFSS